MVWRPHANLPHTIAALATVHMAKRATLKWRVTEAATEADAAQLPRIRGRGCPPPSKTRPHFHADRPDPTAPPLASRSQDYLLSVLNAEATVTAYPVVDLTRWRGSHRSAEYSLTGEGKSAAIVGCSDT
uniref:Uncharacterized protein n=1 Tax=Oryza punctata TaxID=4537 RepID=A0A0E0LS69_ORYPU